MEEEKVLVKCSSYVEMNMNKHCQIKHEIDNKDWVPNDSFLKDICIFIIVIKDTLHNTE